MGGWSGGWVWARCTTVQRGREGGFSTRWIDKGIVEVGGWMGLHGGQFYLVCPPAGATARHEVQLGEGQRAQWCHRVNHRMEYCCSPCVHYRLHTGQGFWGPCTGCCP